MKTNYIIVEVKNDQGNITYYPQYSREFENKFLNFLFGEHWKYFIRYIPGRRFSTYEKSDTLEGAEQIIKNRTTTYVKVHNV
jgi:hypothetical protein